MGDMGIEDPCLEPNAGGWVEDAGKAVGEDRPLGRSPGAWPVRAQCMQAKPFTAGPVTPTAAAAWPASGLGSRPGRSLSCTGSSSGPSPPASRRGRGGAEEEHAVTLHHSRNSNQTGGGGPARAPRPHARPLSYSQPPGQDGRCSPPTAARLLPRMLASPSTNLRAKGQRPRAPCVCAPQRQLERRGRPAPWASSRHCGPSWAGNTRIDPTLYLLLRFRFSTDLSLSVRSLGVRRCCWKEGAFTTLGAMSPSFLGPQASRTKFL